MKIKLLVLALTLGWGFDVNAAFVPVIKSGRSIVTVSYGAGSHTYSESIYGNGSLASLADQMKGIPYRLRTTFDELLRPTIEDKGASFLGSSLTGWPVLKITPMPEGVLLANLSGISYHLRANYSGTRYGIVTFSCTNSTSIDNISVTGQYGSAANGEPLKNVGLTSNPSTSTDCDSNLSWIMPVLWPLLANVVNNAIDQRLLAGINSGVEALKKDLVFGASENYLLGIGRLISPSTVVQLPNGQSFPIGQYVQNNISYLLSNSSIVIETGPGPDMTPVQSGNEPEPILHGMVAKIRFSSPAVSFTVDFSQQYDVRWKWDGKCLHSNQRCQDPR
ncbi:hypothetical protein [Paucibacter sp. B51]|uniref:hypothetical protein n=1 Tax=Paucibacter sp. B51 TaxID=2993315 RepID=UPI0022EBB89A|nr:hypothetical protein [Paucibacter sp. B51]